MMSALFEVGKHKQIAVKVMMIVGTSFWWSRSCEDRG